MHLFFLTRGMKWHRDRFVRELESLHTEFTLKNTEGKEEKKVVSCLLQPIEFWSLVFPEENLQNILRTIEPINQLGFGDVLSCPSPNRKLCLAGMRKLMGLKKIPEYDVKAGPRYPLYKDNMQITGIGIKEDYKNEWGNECL